VPYGSREFAPAPPLNFPAPLLNYRTGGGRVSKPRDHTLPVFSAGGDMDRIVVGLFAVLAIAFATMPPANASAPPRAALSSTTGILQWINGYRDRPDPDSLPAVVRTLSGLQAFKDAETSGAYVGFIAGVLGANPGRAEKLIAKMLAIDPADHWVLVRAIAYSGLPNWKDLLSTFAERMPMRRAMIDKYLDGTLPTLDQIDYESKKPGMMDKVKIVLQLTDGREKPVMLAPSPELIDVLWGAYLATGTYPPVGRIIKLLPLANDKDNVDNLTAGSAAKFTLASNAVRDLTLLNMLKWAAKRQPKEVSVVLNDAIETADTVDTTRMRKESLAAIDELKQKGPNSRRELSGWGQVGAGALSMGCVVAAATGQIELGLPCVIGGAAYSAGMQYISH
jgi:hypothetical protein